MVKDTAAQRTADGSLGRQRDDQTEKIFNEPAKLATEMEREGLSPASRTLYQST
jgi:hypothetical protein